jgi:hypothetical protein
MDPLMESGRSFSKTLLIQLPERPDVPGGACLTSFERNRCEKEVLSAIALPIYLLVGNGTKVFHRKEADNHPFKCRPHHDSCGQCSADWVFPTND